MARVARNLSLRREEPYPRRGEEPERRERAAYGNPSQGSCALERRRAPCNRRGEKRDHRAREAERIADSIVSLVDECQGCGVNDHAEGAVAPAAAGCGLAAEECAGHPDRKSVV